ncbi:MAG: hypothetical protein D6761_04810 [Candidatus Dadabacteria bacterium]|nr:MAG: hypothetical protein D6761_04810 [Candidatus Dadabacteria bacterium]
MPTCLIALLLVLLNACAGAPRIPDTPEAPPEHGAFERVLRMDPITLNSPPDGIRNWGPAEFFEAGNDAYDDADWRTAVAWYDRIIHEYPEHELVPSALFNGGLALEQLNDLGRAEAYFAAIVDRASESELVASALWNLVELREKRAAWSDVLQTIAQFHDLDLSDDERFELEARAWIARAILKPTDANIDRLEAIAATFQERLRRGAQLGRDTLARLYWTVGEIWLGRAQAVIPDPDSRHLEDDLETKAAALLRAQDAYLRTVRALDPVWATAAVFRIGFAYESFYADLINSPAPSALSEDERTVYLEEVYKTLAPVKKKAEMAYERIIRFSRQYSIMSDWVHQAEERLSRLQALELPSPGG